MDANTKCGGVYKKLAQARATLAKKNFPKSGVNKHQNFEYYELRDFMPDILQVCNEVGICGHIWFTSEEALLEIVDVDDGSAIIFREPVSSLILPQKNPQPIQNLGGLKTYHRRYLWMDAMEISENDSVDGADQQAENVAIMPLINTISRLIDSEKVSEAYSIVCAIDKMMRGAVLAQITDKQRTALYESDEYKLAASKKKSQKQQSTQNGSNLMAESADSALDPHSSKPL